MPDVLLLLSFQINYSDTLELLNIKKNNYTIKNLKNNNSVYIKHD